MTNVSFGVGVLSITMASVLAACGSASDAEEGRVTDEKAAASRDLQKVNSISSDRPLVVANKKLEAVVSMDAPPPSEATPEQLRAIGVGVEIRAEKKPASPDHTVLLDELQFTAPTQR